MDLIVAKQTENDGWQTKSLPHGTMGRPAFHLYRKLPHGTMAHVTSDVSCDGRPEGDAWVGFVAWGRWLKMYKFQTVFEAVNWCEAMVLRADFYRRMPE